VSKPTTDRPTFRDEVDAALAYDAAARQAFGEFACLNFPLDGERGACLDWQSPPMDQSARLAFLQGVRRDERDEFDVADVESATPRQEGLW